MLKSFTVENFRGFCRPITFDMTAGAYEYNQAIVYNGLVKNAIVYGKNGVGKSSLGLALFDIVALLTDKERLEKRYLSPYSNLENSSRETKFKYLFVFSEMEVEYSYVKLSADEVLSERLVVNGELLLDYEHTPEGRHFIKEGLLLSLNVPDLDFTLSLVRYIHTNTPANTVPAITQLVSFVDRMLWYRSLSDGNDYAGFLKGGNSIIKILKDKDCLLAFEEFLRQNELQYRLTLDETEADPHLYAVFPDGRKAPFFNIASTGTRALTLFFYWSTVAFPSVSFLFVDEFDAFFHYESAEAVIRKLNEQRNFQTVVTSHNTYLMQNALTRPDCCYIMTKNAVTPLHKATDRIIRQAHNLEKMYIGGVFVA